MGRRLQYRQANEWGTKVQLIFGDMRAIDVPEKADILVSELLGSFGDNELSPECLDGGMRFLKREHLPRSSGVPSPDYYQFTLYVDVALTALQLTVSRSHRPIRHIWPLSLRQNSTTRQDPARTIRVLKRLMWSCFRMLTFLAERRRQLTVDAGPKSKSAGSLSTHEATWYLMREVR